MYCDDNAVNGLYCQSIVMMMVVMIMMMQGCIQVSNFKGEIPLNISEKGGSVHWKGGI